MGSDRRRMTVLGLYYEGNHSGGFMCVDAESKKSINGRLVGRLANRNLHFYKGDFQGLRMHKKGWFLKCHTGCFLI